MTIEEEIRQQAEKVLHWRRQQETAKELLARSRKIWEETAAPLTLAVQDVTATLHVYEERLRQTAMAVYEETKDKRPGPGVAIRIETLLVYDKEEAFRWAIEHGLALKLEEKVFENLVKGNPASFKFVTLQNAPKVTIAQDLEKALEGGKDHAE